MDQPGEVDGRHPRVVRPGAAPAEGACQEEGPRHTRLLHRRAGQGQGKGGRVQHVKRFTLVKCFGFFWLILFYSKFQNLCIVHNQSQESENDNKFQEPIGPNYGPHQKLQVPHLELTMRSLISSLYFQPELYSTLQNVT